MKLIWKSQMPKIAKIQFKNKVRVFLLEKYKQYRAA